MNYSGHCDKNCSLYKHRKWHVINWEFKLSLVFHWTLTEKYFWLSKTATNYLGNNWCQKVEGIQTWQNPLMNSFTQLQRKSSQTQNKFYKYGKTDQVAVDSVLYPLRVPFQQHPKFQLQHLSRFPEFVLLFMPLSVYTFPHTWNVVLYYSDKVPFIFEDSALGFKEEQR